MEDKAMAKTPEEIIKRCLQDAQDLKGYAVNDSGGLGERLLKVASHATGMIIRLELQLKELAQPTPPAPIAAQTEKVTECAHCGRPIEFVHGGWRHWSSAKIDCFLSAIPTKMVPLPAPKNYYKCFGCKQVFLTDEDAEKHFGKSKEREFPACAAEQVDVARLTQQIINYVRNIVACGTSEKVVLELAAEPLEKIIRAASLKQETQPPSELEKSVQRWVNAKRRQITCMDLKGDLQRQVIAAERDVEEALASSPLETPEIHYAVKGNGTYWICEPATPAPADTGAAKLTEWDFDIPKNNRFEEWPIGTALASTGDTPQPQRQKEVIERLCKLTGLVGTKVFGSIEAYDCFCGENPCLPENYQFSEKVLKYIENKVLAALGKTPDADKVLSVALDGLGKMHDSLEDGSCLPESLTTAGKGEHEHTSGSIEVNPAAKKDSGLGHCRPDQPGDCRRDRNHLAGSEDPTL